MDHCTVCLLNDSFPPVIDGVANAVVNYAEELQNAGDRALVVTPEVPGADDAAFPFPVVRYPSIDMRRAIGYVAGYPFSPEVLRQIKDRQVDILHTHCPMSSAVFARSIRGVVDAPLVFTYHTKYDIDISNAIRGKLLQEGILRLLAQNVSACDEVWVVSRGAGENLRSIGYQGDYIVMQNGVGLPRGRVSDEAVRKATAGYDLPEGVPVFLFVGRLMWYKGVRIILDALFRLREQGADFRMVFVGGGGDEAAIRDYAAPLGKQVAFTGPVSDRAQVRAWYSRASLFLFPSTFDTNGLVVREAAASDLASVLIRGSCAAEGVTDGQNAFLIEEDASSMAACLSELCAHRERMAEVGKNAGAQLYLSWEDAVARARERYAVVIDRYRAGGYAAKRAFADEWLHTQGDLMAVLAEVASFGRDGENYLREQRERQKRQREETLAEIREKSEQFWQKLDRYL